MDDTIASIATTVGESSINVIRVSGKEAIKIVNSIFSKDISNEKSHTIHYGFIMNNNEKIDEVLVSIFLSPRSFTTEDVVEIGVHGGISVVSKVMELLFVNGAREAEPGEFLKRAFLNGRIDLTQAEAVSDLISAKTESSRRMAINGVDKTIYKVISELKEKILSLIANIEVNIDYPEYEDAVEVTNDMIGEVVKSVKEKINLLISDSDKGLLIKNGLKIVIAGKPNVGKSSILNSLVNESKAIVTSVKGTTRDIVEGSLIIDGVAIDILDTAGIRQTSDIVESIGVERSINAIRSANLVLFVIDSADGFSDEDKEVFSKLGDAKVLVVYNKADINNSFSSDFLKDYESINISTFDSESIVKLKEKISDIFGLKKIGDANYMYISNARQISLLKKCALIIEDIENATRDNMEVDMIEIDIKRLWESLSEITGEICSDDLLNEIFSKFCLGK